ncbi:MAG: succinate dehydrogenase assembly factor 2 [Alphaproteobacteria bacterium]|nr:succinate dehydrogenase assembly factor 2 [Alphaproteobacteria bacterium]
MAGETDVRRKRLLYRSRRRGMREADHLLGGFAERTLDGFTDEQLDRYERLLENTDPDLLDWITGRAPVPDAFDNDVMDLLKSFKSTIKPPWNH